MARVLQWIWNFDAYDGIRDATNAIVSPAEDWCVMHGAPSAELCGP